MKIAGYKSSRIMAALVLALSPAGFFSNKAIAASATWTGLGGNNFWTNNANWSPAAFPGNQSGGNATTDTATFTNNNPGSTSVNIGGASITISSIVFASGSPAFTFSSGAGNAYLYFPAAGGNITVNSGVTNVEDFSGLPLIRGASGTSTSYGINNNSPACFLKLPVLTQYTTSGNIRIVFSGANGAPISATGSDRNSQTTELLINAPVILYLQDAANAGNFNGGLFVRQGTVSVASVALMSVGHSPLGGANFIYLGNDSGTGNTSTLQFTGAGSGTTDEPFSLTKGNTGVFDITNAAANLILTTTINEINSSSTTLPGTLIKIGPGKLTLNAKASYTGSTTVAGGTLSLGIANAITSSTNLIFGGNSTAGTLDLGGFSQQFSALSVASSAIAASQIITNGSAANPATLVFSNSTANPSTFGGVIVNGSKPVALTVANGRLALTNASTYSGNTTVGGGTLALGAGGAISNSAAIVVNTNATFDVSGNGNFNLNSGQILCGYGAVTGGVAAANCFISPGTNGTTGTLTFTNGLTLNGGVTNHFDLALDPNAAGNDLIAIGGALNLSATNIIEINPLTGTLSPGTYKLFKFGSLGSGGATNFQVTGNAGPSLQTTVTVAAAEIDLVVTAAGGSQRLWAGDGLTNAWNFTSTNWLNSGTPDVYSDAKFVTFDDTGSSTPPINLTATFQPATVLVNAAANYTFSGVGKISGTGSLTKTNSGTLVILTTNNYSGPTAIGQGTLQLGNGTISGTLGTNAIQNSGLLLLNLPGSNGLANVISGTGKLTHISSGTLTLTASNTYSGGTTIGGGTLQLNTGAWFGGGKVTNNGTLIFNSSSNSTVSAVISGTGAVMLANSGTVTLTGNNAYGGGTAVNKGTLLVNNSSGNGTGTGALTVASGATLSGSGAIGGAVTISSGGFFAPGNPAGTLAVSNNFTANSGAVLNYTLGTTSDKTIVSGNLNLSGNLNITAGSGFTSTTYTLFTYGGTLTLGSLTIALPANTSSTIDTNTPGLVNLIVATIQTNIPAFPGALGFGAVAYGGRIGGTVYHVTTLADSGAGSFRDAVSKSNRIIVFDVGGYINLLSAVTASSSLTIAGQTAPGGGIGLMGAELSFYGKNNIICRDLRVRQGGSSSSQSGINIGASSSTSPASNMIFDHTSVEFGQWDSIDAVNTANFTVQYCIIADPINQRFGAHVEGSNASYVNNLWVNGHNRQPLAKANTVYINNVVYNYQAGYTCGDTGGSFSHDIINNYFISGPSTSSASDDFYQIDANQSTYSFGNLRDSSANGTLGGSATDPNEGGPVLTSPWSSVTTNIPTASTLSAYRINISSSGTLPSDQLDQQVISTVTSLGTLGRMFNTASDTGLGNSGYGVITNGTLPLDTDGDAMPDYWEQALGSNPNVADSLTAGTGGYTKLENYLNWLAAPHAVAPKNSFVDVDLRPYTGGFANVSPNYSVMLPTNGTVALLADGHTAEFTAAANFHGLGSFNFSVHGSDGSTMTNTVGVLVTATGLSQNLTWRGDGSLNNWDNTSTNWVNGTNRFTFADGANTTFDDTGSNTPAINLVGTLQPASVTVAANQNYNFAGGGSLGGTMLLAKDGAGILTIGASNTFSGGTFVTGGTVTMGNTTANSYGLGTNTVTLGDGTRLNLFDNGQATDAGTSPNSLVVSGNTTLELPQRGGAGGATLTGSGVFNLIPHWVRGNFNYDCSGFTGTLNVFTPDAGGADFRLGSYAGFANASVNLSNNINAYFISTISPGGNTVDFGQINAPSSAKLLGGLTAGRAVALRIGALNTDSSFAGSIAEQNTGSTTSLIKIGAGALTLGGADTCNGQTIVSNGTLVVNGSTGTNTLTVVNGMLGGGGAIGGGAALYSGNAISPGANINPGTVGTLTLTNGLALTNTTLYFDLASATNSGGGVNDLISLVGGALVLSGTNTVVPDLLNGFLSPGNYTLISGGGSTVGGAANLAWAGSTGTRQAFSFNTATAGTVLLNVAGSPPATLVWSGTNGSAWNVNSTVNWRNGAAADKFYDLDDVIFNDTSTNGSVAISGTVQPGLISITNSILNYNISGGVIGGAGQLSKNGSGNLTLGGSNSFSGDTFINGGMIILSNDVANQFGLGTGAITLSGGTLAMYDNAATADAAFWNLIVPTNSSGMLDADSRCDLYGSLTGGGTFNFYVPSTNTTLYGDWSAFAGTINVTADADGGDFRVNNSAGYPNAAIVLSNKVNAYYNDVVDPAGTTLQIGELSGVGSSSLLGGATAGIVFTWQVGGLDTDATFAGSIAEQNAGAITAIEKIGSGIWNLTGNNTFSGGLTVSGGTLQVNNSSGSAAGTNQVFVAEGATLSGNGSIGGLTVFDDGAILAPGNPSGTLTINNELDLSDLTVLQFGLGTNSDEVVVSGDLNVGGQLNLTDNGGFTTGTYTLFNYGGALTLGNLVVTAAPAGFFYTISTNTPGQVNLVVTHPQFNSISPVANGIVMSGSGGVANGTFYLLGSTNVAAPLNLWTHLVTNQFDASGNFNFTNAISPGTPQSFYRLQLQ